MHFEPIVVARAEVPERSVLWHGPHGVWTVTTPEPAFLVLSRDLHEIARFPLRSSWRGFHGVSPDLERLAVSEREQVSVIDRSGSVLWKMPHRAWGENGSESGSCAFHINGHSVWATTRSEHGDVWQVLNATNGRLLGFAALHCNAAGSEVLMHPDGEHIGLSVGEGQDAARMYWGSFRNGHLRVVEHDRQDRVLSDIHPSGKMFLTTPHGEGPLAVHAFPSGEMIATCDASALGVEVDDQFDFVAAFIDESRAIAPLVESARHAVLQGGGLRPLGFIRYPPNSGSGYPLSAHDGTWVTLDGSTVTRWRASWSS